MTGIQFVTDEKGRKVGVLIDLKKHGAIWQDFWDGFVSESRRKEKGRVAQTMRVPHSFAHFANEWALDCGKALDQTTLNFQRLQKLHPHWSQLSITMRSKAAPLPLLHL